MARNQIVVFKNYKILRKIESVADKVIEKIKSLRGAEIDFVAKTIDLKGKAKTDETLDSVLVDAYAYAWKAIEAVYGIKLYKVQIMGAVALHMGDVAEMRTGEGKTLTGILPAYLNALSGKGVIVVTVNEYLSQRDAFNTGKVFSKLGMSTGFVLREHSNDEKREMYNKDVTYIVHSELGFDYLRDNMVKKLSDKVQRPFNFAVIDEVDSILIDEARTPLIIAGGSNYSDEQYRKADDFVKELNQEDFEIDKETRVAYLNATGITKAEEFYNLKNLYSFENSILVHRIQNALQAHHIFKKDVDYTVKDGEIVLIDIFTGRLLHGRTFSEGLNQAIEAKEMVTIKPETKVIASITYQNLFRMFKKLSGMTGTAYTEEEEFINVYNMRVVPIPTNKPVIRQDLPDVIFSTRKVKLQKVLQKIQEIHRTGQPILVGTRSVKDSEMISEMLDQAKLKHVILNAKNNSHEADIVAQAGQIGSITISTNMAGRGTDIKLGEGVRELGGLFVLGTERHESRRVDNQLRGRSGRQGDVGISQFFVSLEDEVMVRAGLKRIQRFMKSIDDSPLESKTVTKAITASQKKIEGTNYDARKSIIEYDDVANRQRLLTYKQRDHILVSDELYETVLKMLKLYLETQSTVPAAFDNSVFSSLFFIKNINAKLETDIKEKVGMPPIETLQYVYSALETFLEKKFKDYTKADVNNFLRQKMILSLDFNWQQQIEKLSKLKSFIHYRQYAQKNPVQAYLNEAEGLFKQYKASILEQLAFMIFRTSITNQQEQKEAAKKKLKAYTANSIKNKKPEVTKEIEVE